MLHLRISFVIPTLLVLPLTVASQQPDTALRAVVQAGSAYVAEYQRTLTSVVADEIAEQEVVTRMPPDRSAPRLRRTRSEVFFMFVPGTNDFVYVSMGTNDSNYGIGDDQTAANLNWMIDQWVGASGFSSGAGPSSEGAASS